MEGPPACIREGAVAGDGAGAAEVWGGPGEASLRPRRARNTPAVVEDSRPEHEAGGGGVAGVEDVRAVRETAASACLVDRAMRRRCSSACLLCEIVNRR